MSIALVDKVLSSLGVNGGTSGSLNSTGADFLVAVFTFDPGAPPGGLPTDSKSNTGWTACQLQNVGSGVGGLRAYYCIPTTVGSGHTISMSNSNGYMAVAFYAFSGVAQISPLFGEDKAGFTSNNLGPVSYPAGVTTTDPGCLYIVALGCYLDGGTLNPVISSPFNTRDYVALVPAISYGIAASYYIQPSAGNEAPSWNWTGANDSAQNIVMAVFLPPSGGLSKTINSDITFAGIVIKSTSKIISKALTFHGEVVKSCTKIINKSITFHGAVSSQIVKLKIIASDITFHGAIIKSTLKKILSSYTLTSNIPRSIFKLITKSYTLHGSIFKSSSHTISSSYTQHGAVIGQHTIPTDQTVDSSITFSSTLNGHKRVVNNKTIDSDIFFSSITHGYPGFIGGAAKKFLFWLRRRLK